MLVSPTEPQKAVRNLGSISSTPEKYGVDFLWISKCGTVGVQRKAISDLILSVHDGRLGKELVQMEQLDIGVVIIEGSLRWTEGGSLVTNAMWTQAQHQGLLFSIMYRSYWTLHTASLEDTIQLLSRLEAWTNKEQHGSLRATRPKPQGLWGEPNSRDWAVHVLQSFPGCGGGTAEKIFDEYGLPLKWTVTKHDLLAVKGIGTKKAQMLIDSLNGEKEHA